MDLSAFFTNRFTIAVIVPLLLFLAGGFGKKLVRGEKNWKRKDWYLGVDAALAALSAALINIFEISRAKRLSIEQASQYDAQQVATGVFLAISLFLFLFVLGVHQNWEPQDGRAKGQRFWLLGISNIIGLGLMFLFVLVVKGV